MTEKLLDTAVYVAPCEQRNPIELYVNPAGYEWPCQKHNVRAIFKILFLSPKGEVEGFFGSRYFCVAAGCLPDIHTFVGSQDAYLDAFHGEFNQGLTGGAHG